MKKLFINQNLFAVVIIFFSLSFVLKNSAQENSVIITASEPKNDRNEVWNSWKTWDEFPFDEIQMGMSNLEYGGLMEMEHTCFNSIGIENNQKKSQTYWYRISKQRETIEHYTYMEIEVGCWIDNQFKVVMPVTGIIFTPEEKWGERENNIDRLLRSN